MKQLVFIFLIFLSMTVVGQTLEKGVYYGTKLQTFLCYLTYSNSTMDVEYFEQKGGQIPSHFPPKKLVSNMESSPTKPSFKSTDDSITVFVKRHYWLVKRKGFYNIKVKRLSDTTSVKKNISVLRNMNTLFYFYHLLKRDPNYSSLFWQKWDSYGFENCLDLSNLAYDKMLFDARDHILKELGQ